MDDARFDRLTRGIAAGPSRRGLIKIAFGAAAAALGLSAAADAAATKRGPGSICRKDGECVDGAICKAVSGRSVCTCASGFKACGSACIPTAACCAAKDCKDDGNPCTTSVCNPDGTCSHINVRNGAACDSGDSCLTGACQSGVCEKTPVGCPECQACVSGSCQVVDDDTSCGDGKACCGGTCTPLDTAANCGSCGVTCPGSACYPGVCNAGYCSQALDSSCVCDADSDCDDGSACTLSYCSYSSGACSQFDLSVFEQPCVECAGDGECAGGVCCHGRCCAPGGVCSGPGVQGIGVCCYACGGSSNYTCCDSIRLDEVAAHVLIGMCIGEDQARNLPSQCCPNGTGGYQFDENGNPVRDENGNPVFGCVAPVFHR